MPKRFGGLSQARVFAMQLYSFPSQLCEVTDAKKANVGVRKGPSTASERIGRSRISGFILQFHLGTEDLPPPLPNPK
eukprot:122738-Amphidinium_carterae.1